MTPDNRVQHPAFASKIMSADDAAALIAKGATIGMSGFTGSGYPKAVPEALARRIAEAKQHDEHFAVSVWTGASTGPDLDGALAGSTASTCACPTRATRSPAPRSTPG